MNNIQVLPTGKLKDHEDPNKGQTIQTHQKKESVRQAEIRYREIRQV